MVMMERFFLQDQEVSVDVGKCLVAHFVATLLITAQSGSNTNVQLMNEKPNGYYKITKYYSNKKSCTIGFMLQCR